MEKLNQILSAFKDIPVSSKEKILNHIHIIELKKGAMIAESGKNHDNMYILETGIARSFYTDKKNKEYIRNLFVPSRAIGALGALILDKASRFSYDCLSDCRLYFINFKKFKELAREDIYIQRYYATILEQVFLELEAKVYDLSVLNATERYFKLKKRIPTIENLIPQYHIASYLNITPVQLSRIRKQLINKDKK